MISRARNLVNAARSRAKRALGGAPAEAPLSWAIKVPAPDSPEGDVWGDVFYAEDLARALRRLGQTVYVDRWETRRRPDPSVQDDVAVHLRGFHRPELVDGAVNILWIISHPDWVSEEELDLPFDLRLAASVPWAAVMSRPDREIRPLLQATNVERFTPEPQPGDLESGVLFVGRSRNIFRPIVRDSIAAGADLEVYGDLWEQFIDGRHIKAEYLDNAAAPGAYRGARIVLNDHWDDMAQHGFVSNRLFDAVAAGAVVVSDEITGGFPVEFGGSVRTYASVDELRGLLAEGASGWPTPEERAATSGKVAEFHSFDARAMTLLVSAREALAARA
ncbi:hypothetical protein C5E10_03920 [Pseudoclavibacter sp. RFBG4]|uniref:glycosyltransferase family protein n=1 Tax=Pseudoclavibacter sp. RFBG4 TaxID=2080575 RepID=UPI000CE84CF1|nr:hypothetical protein [Pseudoclavibacter sp. RFBG4]PPG35432.1 hypothetical protein C5E10_03920 [Pseudoclavibacter sp. RFBG4]